jgi:transposase-like protein
MASNNSKYSEDMIEGTARHIIESRKSATSMAVELGIDTNTVYRWVWDY